MAEPVEGVVPKEEPESEEKEPSVGSRDTTPGEPVAQVKNPIPGVELESKTRLKITVKKLHVCCEWRWMQGGDDTCGICRMEFESACNTCKFPGENCPLVVGACRHAFHRHCIDKWTATAAQNTQTPQCPLCRQDWQEALPDWAR